MKEHNVNLAIALEVPIEEILNRVKGRWIHLPSGRVYNETFNAPKIPKIDDVTGEDLVQRPDDTPEAVERRLELYKSKTQPLLQLYEEHGVLKRFVGTSSDEMWPHICEEIANLFKPSPKSN